MGLGVAAVVTAVAPRGASTVVDVAASDPAAPASVPTIYVHILGKVAAPGIYQLPDGSRVVDAVAADLRDGSWDRRHGALRGLEEYDAGLRLIVARAS
ncbi:MAG: hypothetical protein KC468_36955 [Myxococcales bacterium]|nr:hypothetical protein [Myxococcales bacterium]